MSDPTATTTDPNAELAASLKALAQQFVDALTPAHHKSAAVPFASLEVPYKELLESAELLAVKACETHAAHLETYGSSIYTDPPETSTGPIEPPAEPPVEPPPVEPAEAPQYHEEVHPPEAP